MRLGHPRELGAGGKTTPALGGNHRHLRQIIVSSARLSGALGQDSSMLELVIDRDYRIGSRGGCGAYGGGRRLLISHDLKHGEVRVVLLLFRLVQVDPEEANGFITTTTICIKRRASSPPMSVGACDCGGRCGRQPTRQDTKHLERGTGY
jgi:hypothetical protein